MTLADVDCPSCSAASTLEVLHTEMGTDYCVCTCCGKHARVRDGLAERNDRVRFDVNGVEMNAD